MAKISDVAKITYGYLARADVSARLEECAEILAQGLALREGVEFQQK